ncbi:sulfotransferase [Dasania sp. GY-MA-18]|uniref:Sulfotransferase n=1 Tax=Dasania phycosphaerae TaxID=2950436 RepID=A0A9J6RLB6_9GAMM|nr:MULTISPECIES: tetratricopeptide repeat-containing sulfotransferase family protein [Dasania]MCR8922790.1 sulfotransferase [Dasania sp. GY-MA-18]MCZ0865220.1 sulfotransferase [Dasania phycosphaerae]MCZ0868946.1 sulfotransferase [Dasania phycosphaerae]
MQAQSSISHRHKRHYKQAEQALLAGRINEAQQLAEALLKQCPQFDNAWFLLSLVYQRLNRNSDALQLIDRALLLSPQCVHFLAQRCALLLRLGKFKEALLLAQQTLNLGVHDAWSQDVLGVVLSTLDEHALALPLFAKACQQQANNPQFLYNLASAERVCGKLEQAQQHLRAALNIKPNFSKALWSLSGLLKAQEAHQLIAELEQQLQRPQLPAMDSCYLHYALAKQYEDLQQWDSAYQHFQLGAASRRSLVPYDGLATEQLFSAIKQASATVLDASCDSEAGYNNDEPIFIVGMPRTGTTLVERILAAHSDVYGAGELRQFPMAITAMLKPQADSISANCELSPQAMAAAAGLNMAELGEHYINNTRPRTGHTAKFTDKLPLNFLYMGLIARALPRAKFIHVQRNPMDTCWSNFKQLFGAMYAYSYSLQDTAHFYGLYHNLMQHWQGLMPQRIYNLHYEDLVQNQEQESKKLLAFCELPWQPACLDFHRSESGVATASSVQVRQKIYQSSLQRWQQYPQLQGLRQSLQEMGVVLD